MLMRYLVVAMVVFASASFADAPVGSKSADRSILEEPAISAAELEAEKQRLVSACVLRMKQGQGVITPSTSTPVDLSTHK